MISARNIKAPHYYLNEKERKTTLEAGRIPFGCKDTQKNGFCLTPCRFRFIEAVILGLLHGTVNIEHGTLNTEPQTFDSFYFVISLQLYIFVNQKSNLLLNCSI